MKTIKLVALTLLIICSTSLCALQYISASAFNPEIRNEFHNSLLNYPQASREDSISVYGSGLHHPFASFSRLGDAMIDVFRPGKAHYSMLAYQSPDKLLKAEFNFLAGFEPSREDASYSFIYKGFDLEAEIGKHWQLNTSWWNGMFFGDQAAAATSELIDGYYSVNSDKLNPDNLKAELSYNAKNLNLALGRRSFPIGQSISGSVILNDSVNDYTYLLAEGRIGAFSLSFLHSTLMADSSYSIYTYPSLNSKNYPDKYLALHQLGYHPRKNLNLFLGETVIYGNRSLDLNYILPNAFWRATEHNLHDRDNVMIYGGANYRPVNPVVLYAQFALDEFSYGEAFSNWWGNKYAVQGGLRYIIPLALPDSAPASVTAELTAVRPFTYTHYLNHTLYTHDGKSLGYPKGSNIVDFSTLVKLPFKDLFLWQSGFSYSKQGSFGSDHFQNYNDVFPGSLQQDGTADWFQGTITKTTELKSSLLIDVFAHHRILAGIILQHQDTWKNRLFGAWQFVF